MYNTANQWKKKKKYIKKLILYTHKEYCNNREVCHPYNDTVFTSSYCRLNQRFWPGNIIYNNSRRIIYQEATKSRVGNYPIASKGQMGEFRIIIIIGFWHIVARYMKVEAETAHVNPSEIE